MGVRARDPPAGEELHPELSVPPAPLLPRGPERPTPTPGLARGARRAPCLAQHGQLSLGGEEKRWWSWQQNSQALVAGLDQGKVDQEAAVGGLPLPRQAGLQTVGRFPPPTPSLRQGDSAPCLPCLVPARGPSSPHHGIHGLFILSHSPPTQTLSRAWGILLPSPPSPCPSLFPFYLLGRGRGEGTGRRDSPCPGARGGHSYCGLSPFPWLGADLIKKETRALLALFRARDREGREMMKGCLGGQAEAGTPLFSGGDSHRILRRLELLSTVRLGIDRIYSNSNPLTKGMEGGKDGLVAREATHVTLAGPGREDLQLFPPVPPTLQLHLHLWEIRVHVPAPFSGPS